MIHFGQMYEDQQTARFDYGSDHENMKHYNSTKPPAYSINPINTTVSLFYSQNDWLADVQVGGFYCRLITFKGLSDNHDGCFNK